MNTPTAIVLVAAIAAAVAIAIFAKPAIFVLALIGSVVLYVLYHIL